MKPGITVAPSSATSRASPPIAPRTSSDVPIATIRPSRTPTAWARGRAKSIVTTLPSSTNARASLLVICSKSKARCRQTDSYSPLARTPMTAKSMREGTTSHIVDEELSDPASYLTVRRGDRVYDLYGWGAGRVDEPRITSTRDELFDGLVVDFRGRRLFVDAPEVKCIHDGVVV